MISAISKSNLLIRLTDERVNHILKNHPELKDCINWITETVENPDFITAGDFGEFIAIRKFDKTPVTFINILRSFTKKRVSLMVSF